MAAVCDICAKKPGFGHNRPWSRKITKRRFNPNIQRKHYWVPSLGRRITLNVSARGIKTIDRLGIDVVVARILARGEKV